MSKAAIDPMRDAETVETELMLADLDSLEKRLVAAQKRARGGDKESVAQVALMEPIVAALQEGRPARTAIPPDQEEAVKRLQLLTSKPVLYVCNVEEGVGRHRQRASPRASRRARAAEGARVVIVSAAIEAEVANCRRPTAREFLEGLGLHDSGLDRVIRAGYDLLGLMTYFTVGPEGGARLDHRARHQGAAGRRRRSTATSSAASSPARRSPMTTTSPARARSAPRRPGRMRVEGKEYVVKDGDVLLFRFNV